MTKKTYNLGNNGKIINPQENLLRATNIYIFVLGADEYKVYTYKNIQEHVLNHLLIKITDKTYTRFDKK